MNKLIATAQYKVGNASKSQGNASAMSLTMGGTGRTCFELRKP
jgi:hypothetical protein